MRREDLSDLTAFLTVAEEGSFTRAAAKLGTSQSALSRVIRRLEGQIGVRLLARTTRSVVPTEAGERVLATLRPALDDIGTMLASVGALREKPSGTIRITAGQHAVDTLLWPTLERLLPSYPDVKVELSLDYGLRDIVADRFDAGVRLGERVERDMVAVRIGPDQRMAVVGSPAYLAPHPAPVLPSDLADHACINLRFPTLGGLYAWEFEKGERKLNVRVDGQLVFNDVGVVLRAARAGFGLACVLEDLVSTDLQAGSLVRVLSDWCAPFPGYHLYYPSRRQPTPAFRLVVEALRHRA